MQTVNILGAEYTISVEPSAKNPKLTEVSGYCDCSNKTIVVTDMLSEPSDVMDVANKKEVMKKILRHEIVHAMLSESGLQENSEWARNEEMVDWIAIQFPKLLKVFEEVDII